MTNTNSITREVHIQAPRSRVWQALTTVEEFGQWFRMRFEKDTSFTPGAEIKGQATKPGYNHTIAMRIDRIEPQSLFAYYWHPYCIDPKVDYSKEEPTLVIYKLADAPDGKGTLLTVTESGFDKIPLARRAEAFNMHTQGWPGVLENFANHVRAQAA